MAGPVYRHLDIDGVSTFSNGIFKSINIRIAERIVEELDDSSRDDQVLSSRTLYSIFGDLSEQVAVTINKLSNKIAVLTDLINSYKHLTYRIYVGDITAITDPSEDVIYLQKDNDEDKTWVMYVYGSEGAWIAVGDTTATLANYWSKNELETLRSTLDIHDVEPIPEATVQSIVESASV